MIIDRRYQEATTQNTIDRKKKVEKVFGESKGRIYVRSYFFKSCNTFELKMSGPLAYWKIADHDTGVEKALW